MKKKLLIVATAMGILPMAAFSASAASCGKSDREAFRQYKQETAPLITALKAKEIELKAANTFGVSEALATQIPDIAGIEALESDVKVLEGKINAVAAKYGIAVCCR